MRVIPLDISRGPIVEVDGFPERIITGPERPAFPLKFVTEHEVVPFAVSAGVGMSAFWSIAIHELRHVRKVGHLACPVDAAEVEARTDGFWLVCPNNDGVPGEEHEQAHDEDDERRSVHPSSRREQSE